MRSIARLEVPYTHPGGISEERFIYIANTFDSTGRSRGLPLIYHEMVEWAVTLCEKTRPLWVSVTSKQ